FGFLFILFVNKFRSTSSTVVLMCLLKFCRTELRSLNDEEADGEIVQQEAGMAEQSSPGMQR
ncbi:hypothetical protein ILYODFUR_038051, partial [Ilyodon furcidens]